MPNLGDRLRALELAKAEAEASRVAAAARHAETEDHRGELQRSWSSSSKRSGSSGKASMRGRYRGNSRCLIIRPPTARTTSSASRTRTIICSQHSKSGRGAKAWTFAAKTVTTERNSPCWHRPATLRPPAATSRIGQSRPAQAL